MDIIVHIGTEKTGTTTIQDFLHKNRANLTRLGLHVLQTLEVDTNRDMVAYCMRDDRMDEYLLSQSVHTPEQKALFKGRFLDRFEQEIASIPPHVTTVLVSSEHFHSRLIHDDEIVSLKTLLAKNFKKVRILTYIRKQIDMAISAYSTSLKSGYGGDFRDLMEDQFSEENHYFNHHVFLGKWVRAFGKEGLTVKIFDRKEFWSGSLIDDFCHEVQPSILAHVDTNVAARNEAIHHFGQCLLKSVNRHFPRVIEGLGFNPRSVEIAELVTEEAKGGGAVLDAAYYRELQSRFDRSNEALRREYFPDRNTLFDEGEPKLDDRSISEENEILLDKVIAILTRAGQAPSGEVATSPHHAEMIADLTRQVAELRTNRALLHRQLVSVSDELAVVTTNRDGLLQQLALTNERLASRDAELARLNAGLVNRILRRLGSKLRRRPLL